MTPEEAVNQLGNRLDKSERNALGMLFHSVAATAKAEETRRCADMVRELQGGNLMDAHLILRSGGLEVDE